METTDLTLPQITEELRAIVTEIIDAGGEVDAETDARHDELVDLAERKTESYIAVIRELEAKASALNEVARHYQDKRNAVERTIDRLKETLLWSMQAAGDEVRETTLGKVRVQQASRRGIVVDVDAEELPDELKRVSVSPDKRAIRAYLEEHGIEHIADGDRVLAHLDEPSYFVRIY